MVASASPVSEIPVVDIGGFATGSADRRAALGRRMRAVGGELGFLYLAGAVDAATASALIAAAEALFASPGRAGLVTPRRLTCGLACGYAPPGYGNEDAATIDIKEALDLYRPGTYVGAMYPAIADDPLPAELAAPLAVFAAHHAHCRRVAADVLRALAIGFELPEDWFAERHGTNDTLRVLHYPPVAGAAANAMRIGAHTDFGTLTLLVQDPSGGLDVLAPDGRWLAAPAIPGTVLVNIGDLLQRWTNDELRSTLHRVAVPADARATRSRYAIPFFCEPGDDVEIACIPTARGAEQPRFPAIGAGAYMRGRLSRTLVPGA
jgi:isopenicillin N synthase-like dioxygenase